MFKSKVVITEPMSPLIQDVIEDILANPLTWKFNGDNSFSKTFNKSVYITFNTYKYKDITWISAKGEMPKLTKSEAHALHAAGEFVIKSHEEAETSVKLKRLSEL